MQIINLILLRLEEQILSMETLKTRESRFIVNLECVNMWGIEEL